MRDPRTARANLRRKPRLFIECGCCGAWHRNDFYGDCRNDNNRFGFDELPDDAQVVELEGGWPPIGKELLTGGC